MFCNLCICKSTHYLLNLDCFSQPFIYLNTSWRMLIKDSPTCSFWDRISSELQINK